MVVVKNDDTMFKNTPMENYVGQKPKYIITYSSSLWLLAVEDDAHLKRIVSLIRAIPSNFLRVISQHCPPRSLLALFVSCKRYY